MELKDLNILIISQNKGLKNIRIIIYFLELLHNFIWYEKFI